MSNPYHFDENPYAVEPAAQDAVSQMSGSQYYVDGNQLMIPKAVELPEICILTGERDDLVRIKKTLIWSPPWLIILVLINLIVLLIVYLFVRKKCTVAFSMSRRVRSARLSRLVIGWLVLVAGIFSSFVIGQATNIETGFVIAGLSFITGLILIVSGSLPLKVTRHDKGQTFWISGFKPAFFMSLREMYNA